MEEEEEENNDFWLWYQQSATEIYKLNASNVYAEKSKTAAEWVALGICIHTYVEISFVERETNRKKLWYVTITKTDDENQQQLQQPEICICILCTPDVWWSKSGAARTPSASYAAEITMPKHKNRKGKFIIVITMGGKKAKRKIFIRRLCTYSQQGKATMYH